MTQKVGKDMPFWVVKFKDSDGNIIGGDGFMLGCKSRKEADKSIDRLYRGGYRGVVDVIPKPET